MSAPTPTPAVDARPFSASRMRWAVLALLFGSTVLNYVDRQTLSILAPQLQKDLGIDDLGYARIVQYFLVAYTFAYLGAGWLTDRLGTKLSLTLFVGWWSLAGMVTGLVQNAAQLALARTALGLGEAGNYTAGPKAVADNFPPAERGFAIGVYTAGAMVGATVAPPLIAWLAIAYGWRMAFVATGAAGFVWMLSWLAIYRTPAAVRQASGARRPTPWRAILRERPIWGFALARMVADPVWYFYLFWFPKYLMDERAMSLPTLAGIAWIVYLAADFGSVGGGLLSGALIRRGMAPARGRLVTMGGAVLLAPLGMLIATGVGIPATIALAAIVAFAHLVFQINMAALIVDLYPVRVVATVFGLIAAGSGIGGIMSTQLIGSAAASSDYSIIFVMMGVLHPIAWILVWGSLRLQPISALRKSPDEIHG